jgi:hypothetical protein
MTTLLHLVCCLHRRTNDARSHKQQVCAKCELFFETEICCEKDGKNSDFDGLFLKWKFSNSEQLKWDYKSILKVYTNVFFIEQGIFEAPNSTPAT